MLLSKVEPKGANYTTSYEYNALRSLTKVTDANNSSWNFQYDDVQNLTQKEDALNRITSYEYDNLDRLDKTTQPLSKITTYGYDNNSNVLTTTDPKNQTMTYTYDELDRVDTGIYRNELNAEKLFHDYKYDAEDNLYEVAERVDFTNNRTYTRTFDKRNRLKSSTDAYSKTVAFTYDTANNLKSLTDAGSKVTSYNYDSQNRLDTVAQNSSTIADYDWYSDGLLKQVKYSETSKRDYNYDNADRVSNITNTYGSNSESFDYGYDANSNRETEARNINGAVSKTIAYGYDQLNRLESASYTANSATNQLSYTYDAVGNRKTESGTDQNGVAVNKTADYDDLDRLTQLTDGSLVSDFEYDDNSNLTKVQLNGTDNETFEYDIRNQLSKYTSIGNGITADYDYDFERKRLSKTVSNVRRDYVYAGNQVINEYVKDTIADTNPVLNASYGIGSGEVVKSDFAGEGSRNYFSDALGSITSLADTSSSLISRNDYDSFGEIVSSTGLTQNAVTYTGQRLDVESGLMALGNGERYYNPSYGRFIQQDSYAGMPDMPQSLNRFAYTYNNPFSYTDPSGNNPQEVGKSLTGNQTLDWYVRFGVSLATQTPTKEKFNQSLELWNEWALGFGDAFNATGKFVAAAIHNPSGTASNMWEGVKSLASDWSEMAQDPLGTVSALKDTFLENPKLVMRHLGQTSGEAVIARGLTPVKTLAKAPIKAGLKKGLQKAKNSKLGQATTQVATHTVSKISSKATTLKTSAVNASSKLKQSFDETAQKVIHRSESGAIHKDLLVPKWAQKFAKNKKAQKKVFDPAEVDDFLETKLSEVPKDERFFLIGEGQKRVNFVAEKLGYKQATQFWSPKYNFGRKYKKYRELFEEASVDFNKYLIKKLHQKEFKFMDLGKDGRKSPSIFYKAEQEVLKELGVKPLKIKPKFNNPYEN